MPGWKTEANKFEIADYLLIKLLNVIVGLPLGLNVDRMILDTFSCGHDSLLPRETKKWVVRVCNKRRYAESDRPYESELMGEGGEEGGMMVW